MWITVGIVGGDIIRGKTFIERRLNRKVRESADIMSGVHITNILSVLHSMVESPETLSLLVKVERLRSVDICFRIHNPSDNWFLFQFWLVFVFFALVASPRAFFLFWPLFLVPGGLSKRWMPSLVGGS